MIIPEILAPAGDKEALVYALEYGCSAVYLAGKSFGMRAAAKNFDSEGLYEAAKLAHSKNAKVYIACNTVLTNEEIPMFPEFIRTAYDAGIDAVIASDLGVMSMVREYAAGLAIHASTQTGIMNYRTALELYRMGVRRVVLARELSLADIKTIRKNIPEDMELEVFVHGAMCVSFSGRCLLSEYLTGRDANRGQCAQPCRWGYYLMEETRPGEFFKVFEDERGSYILNARDMCMIEHLGDLMDAGVTSFKIEGRAKSAYYSAVTANAYKVALNSALKGEPAPEWAVSETEKISHRPYCTGFFYGHPNAHDKPKSSGGQYYQSGGYIRRYDFVGTIDGYENGNLLITQRNYFTVNDELEILEPLSAPVKFSPKIMYGKDRIPAEVARHAAEKLKVPYERAFKPYSLIRKKLQIEGGNYG